jgi:hypothetical protein
MRFRKKKKWLEELQDTSDSNPKNMRSVLTISDTIGQLLQGIVRLLLWSCK